MSNEGHKKLETFVLMSAKGKRERVPRPAVCIFFTLANSAFEWTKIWPEAHDWFGGFCRTSRMTTTVLSCPIVSELAYSPFNFAPQYHLHRSVYEWMMGKF